MERDVRETSPLDEGDVFAGRYRLAEELGGGFTAVFRAEDEQLGREVALKVLDRRSTDEQLAYDRWIGRFEREARIVSDLKDPNTVRIYDFGRGESVAWYIVFEFIEGRTLAELGDELPLAPERVVRIARQVLRSLREAHRADVLHRDIKPANLMLCDEIDREEWVKVLDFGIAKPVAPDAGDASDVTDEQTVLGTPQYMAPEQVVQGELTPATDLYGLGLVLWELLVGEHPIQTDDRLEVYSRHVHEEPFQLPDDCDVSEPLRTFVDRLLQKEPDRRYVDAGAALEALDEIAETMEVADEGESSASEIESGDGGLQEPDRDEPETPPDGALEPNTLEERDLSVEEDEPEGREGELPEWAVQASAGTDANETRYEEVAPAGDDSSADEASGNGETESDDAADADDLPDLAEVHERRRDESGGWLGTLGWVVVPALAVVLGYGLWTSGGFGTFWSSTTELARSAAGPEYSSTGIFQAVATSRWRRIGETSRVDFGDGQWQMQRFRWGDARLRVRVRRSTGGKPPAKPADGVRALVLGGKRVELELRNSTETAKLRSAYRSLLDYRSMMREE